MVSCLFDHCLSSQRNIMSCGLTCYILCAKCADLNLHGSHRLRYLNMWCLVGGTDWKGLEGVALLKEVCHWGVGSWFWGFKSPCYSQSLSPLLSSPITDKDVSSQLLLQYHAFLPTVILSTMMVMVSPSETVSSCLS